MDQPLSLPDLLRSAAARWPDQEAIACELGDRKISFGMLDAWSDRLAAVLIEKGVHPGDVVSVMLPNRIEFPVLWLGILKAGAIMTPINVSYRREDRNHLISHSNAVAFVGEAAAIASVENDRELFPKLVWVATPEELESSSHSVAVGGLPRVHPFSTANIQYTSGTTGMPKGCVLSHAYWVRFGQTFLHHGPRLTSQDRILTAQAFSYADPQWNVAAALASGASLTILEKFSPSRFWKQVGEARTTFFYCLGAMPTLLLKTPPSHLERDHQVRLVICSAIPPDRHRELEERFGMPWLEAFGTTETGADLIVDVEEHDALVGSGSLGCPVAGKEARIVDASGHPLPPGSVGELAIRGVGMMERYHDDPDATARTFRGGSYHTGDLAVQDAHGRFIYVGRTKDMIRRGGENVAAVEVEAVLQSHPDVLLAACVPVPDEIYGEEIKAFVVLRNGAEGDGASAADMKALYNHVAARLARFKIPRYWEAVASLPMTPSERVIKPALVASETRPPRGIDLAGDR
ncbi:MAG: AMP-binding protein [Caulobacter sp.]|nr:AMP-binding protein [Caulobacter sp.]